MPRTKFRPARLNLLRLESRVTPALVFAGSTQRDLVFDAARNQLLISTTAGSIQRYSVATGQLLAPIDLAGAPPLNGMDITPDGSTLVVADNNPGATQGFVYRIDLATQAVTNLTYDLDFGESGAWDVMVTSNSKAMVTTRYSGSGWTPLRDLDLASGTFSVRTNLDSVRQNSSLARSADRSSAILGESNISSGPLYTYSAASDTFGTACNTSAFLDNVRTAVNRDGTLFAAETSLLALFDSAFKPLETFAGIDGGIAFDPVRDRVYGINSTTDELVAYDTTTLRELFRVAIGENVSTSGGMGAGTLITNATGTLAFLATATGVQQIALPSSTGVASKLAISGFPSYTPAGTAGTVTVTVLDAAGAVDDDFTGTVTITSAASASLPAAYTFTLADAGRKSFPATIHSLGTSTLTANSSGLASASQTGIVTHNLATVSNVPVADYRGMVYDTARDLLYIATPRGVIERYSPATRTLLAPWSVGGSLLGIDLAPDGSAVYVTDGNFAVTGGLVRKVSTTTGAVSRIGYRAASGEGAAWDVAIFNNGRALVTTQYQGSGWTPLRELDLATDTLANIGTLTVRQNSNLSRGFDRTLGMLSESNISSGPIRTYDAATATVSASKSTGSSITTRPHAVNRDGTRIALESSTGVSILNSTLGSVINLTGPDAGMAFDSLQDRLYAARSTGSITVYNTTTWAVAETLTVTETIPASTTFTTENMVVSDDSRWLFLGASAGVHARRLVTPTQTALALSAATLNPAEPVTLTATVTGGLATERVGHTVQFRNGATVVASAILTAAGTATFTGVLPVATYNLTANYVATTGYAASTSAISTLTITPQTGLPLTTIAVNTPPASIVRQIVLTFNNPVILSGSPFLLERLGAGGGTVTTTASSNAAGTIVTLVPSGSFTFAGSLLDGRYRLTVQAAAVTDYAGLAIDGDSNGTAGGNKVLNFHRLFGDADGNATVDAADMSLFGAAFNTASTNFDFDSNGIIDATDFAQFGNRFGLTL